MRERGRFPPYPGEGKQRPGERPSAGAARLAGSTWPGAGAPSAWFRSGFRHAIAAPGRKPAARRPRGGAGSPRRWGARLPPCGHLGKRLLSVSPTDPAHVLRTPKRGPWLPLHSENREWVSTLAGASRVRAPIPPIPKKATEKSGAGAISLLSQSTPGPAGVPGPGGFSLGVAPQSVGAASAAAWGVGGLWE